MIQRDPADRLTAEEYLKVYKGGGDYCHMCSYLCLSFAEGDVFPEYFYSFLHGYFRQFSITLQLTPDKCIQKYAVQYAIQQKRVTQLIGCMEI